MTRGLAPALAVLGAVAVGSAGAAPLVPLRGTIPRAVAGLRPAGEVPADLRLGYVTIVLGLRDREGLAALIAAQQDRRSPRHRRWLDPEEIADRFGTRRDDYEEVRRHFTAHGLRVVRDSPFRVSFVVAGAAARLEAAVGTRLALFRDGGRTFRAPLREPALPANLAAQVRGILGLDDLPAFRPLVQLAGGRTALGPAEFATAYAVGPLRTSGLAGAGRVIAVIARSNFRDADVAAFAERYLGTTPNVVRVFAGPDPGILVEPREETEVLLDTQWAAAMAPAAIIVPVIGSRDGGIPAALERAVAERIGDVITLSFGICEPAAPAVATELFDAFYAIANAQGQTVLVASGDGGSRDCIPEAAGLIAVNALASSPHAVAVGGTSFALEADGTLLGPPLEATWFDQSGAGGGGLSGVFARPRFQLAAGLGTVGRALPDLALAASPRTPGYVIVQANQDLVVGGTSAGPPSLGSVLALLNEQLVRTTGVGGLGQFLPTLYRLGSEQARGLRPPVFRDVVAGTIGDFAAGPGFDLATGWGAPLADALAAAVDGPGACEPALDCLVPARGPRRRACAGEWLLERSVFLTRRGIPRAIQTCRDGDPSCDVDGAVDGRCTLNVALCLNVFDFRALARTGANRGLPLCGRGQVRQVRLLAPRTSARDPEAAVNRAALEAAIGVLPLPTELDAACTGTVPITVPLAGRRARGRTTLLARVEGSRGTVISRATLRCTGR